MFKQQKTRRPLSASGGDTDLEKLSRLRETAKRAIEGIVDSQIDVRRRLSDFTQRSGQ